MSNVKLDLKQFKYLGSDGKTTRLRHKDGHELTLAHKSLSPEAQAQLQQLSTQVTTPLEADELKHKGMAEGGKIAKQEPETCVSRPDTGYGAVICKADGGSVQSNPSLTESKKGHKCEGKRFCMHCGSQMPQMYADGTPPGGVPDGDQAIPDPSAAQAAPTNTPDPDISARQKADLDNKAAQASNLNAVKQVYNQKLSASGNVVSQDDMFGPDGEAPKNPVNPTLWGQAKNSNSTEQLASQQMASRESMTKANDAIKSQQAAHEQAVAQNATNQELGLPLVPDPGAPDTGVQNQQKAGQVLSTGMQQGASNGMPFPNTSDDSIQGPEAGIAAGFQTQLAGIGKEAAAAGALGEQKAAIDQQHIENQQHAQQAFQQSYNNLEQERQAHIQDIQNGFINPDKYWMGDASTGEGGHSKILAGIGMVLAGFNPTSNPNAAINMIKFQMDRNLEAQKQNLGAKQNLLAANLKQFGNLRDATDMTRIMQADIVSHQLDAASQKAMGGPNGLAAARAMQMKGPIMREAAQVQFQMGLRHAMMKLSNGTGGDPSNTGPAEQMINMLYQYNPEMAKQFAGRVVPGVGVSSSQTVEGPIRAQLLAHQKLQAGLADLQQWVKTHSTKLGNPLDPDYVTGESKVRQLQANIREGVLGTVYREGEQPLLDKLLKSNPAGILKNNVTLPQLQQLQQSTQRDFDLTKKSVGIPVGQPQSPAGRDFSSMEGKTGTQNGRRFKIVNGQQVFTP